MDNAWPIGRCLIYKFPHWIRIRFCFKHCLQNKSHQNLMLTTFALMSRLATSHLFWTETSLLKLLLGVQAYTVATSDPAYMQSKFFHFANQSIMFYCCLDCVRLQWLIFNLFVIFSCRSYICDPECRRKQIKFIALDIIWRLLSKRLHLSVCIEVKFIYVVSAFAPRKRFIVANHLT